MVMAKTQARNHVNGGVEVAMALYREACNGLHNGDDTLEKVLGSLSNWNGFVIWRLPKQGANSVGQQGALKGDPWFLEASICF